MKAGRELDEAIAKEIMGWTVACPGNAVSADGKWYVCPVCRTESSSGRAHRTEKPFYSTNITAAIRIPSKIRGHLFRLETVSALPIWKATFSPTEHAGSWAVVAAEDASPSVAICEAALIVVRAGRLVS